MIQIRCEQCEDGESAEFGNIVAAIQHLLLFVLNASIDPEVAEEGRGFLEVCDELLPMRVRCEGDEQEVRRISSFIHAYLERGEEELLTERDERAAWLLAFDVPTEEVEGFLHLRVDDIIAAAELSLEGLPIREALTLAM